MKKRQVLLTIDREGQVRAEAQGFQGPTCLEMLQPLLHNLGQITESTPTADFYLPPQLHEGFQETSH